MSKPLPYKVLGMDNGKEKRLMPDGSVQLVKPESPPGISEADEKASGAIRELNAQVTTLRSELAAKDAQITEQAEEITRLTAMVETQKAEIEKLTNEAAAKPAEAEKAADTEKAGKPADKPK
jgi:predicted RNase H-like nuclease (RuvC/YqgF family)